MEPKDWVFFALGIGELVLLYQQNNIMKRELSLAGDAPHAGDRTGWFKIYWPLMAMVALCAGSWIPFFLAPSAAPDYFLSWAGKQGGGAVADINTSSLESQKGSRRLMLVCVAIDPSFDTMNNTHIMKSRTYEIETPTMTLQAQPTPDFVALETFGTNIQLYLIEAPENFAIERVTTLSDVSRLGGKILDHKGFATTGISPIPH
jgi:hypothetical protein